MIIFLLSGGCDTSESPTTATVNIHAREFLSINTNSCYTFTICILGLLPDHTIRITHSQMSRTIENQRVLTHACIPSPTRCTFTIFFRQ